MLRENWRFISRVERLADFLIVIGAFFLAYYGRSSLLFWNQSLGLGLPFEGERLAPVSEYLVALVTALIGYGTTLRMYGAYGSMRMSSMWTLLKISILSSVWVFIGLAAVLYLVKLDLSRSFIGLFCLLSAVFLLLERYVVLRLLRYWRRRGRNFRNMLICGTGEQAQRIYQEIVARPELGIGVRGVVDLTEESFTGEDLWRLRTHFSRGSVRTPIQQEPVFLAGLPRVVAELSHSAIDEVIFTDVVDVMPAVEELVLICSEQGIRTTIAADLFSFGMVTSDVSYFGGMPLIHYQTPPGDRWELSLKRCIDVSVSCILLLLLLPIFLFIAGGIYLTSGLPILFKQKRVGLNGRIFSLYKFRSMVKNAEDMLPHLSAYNEMGGPVFKMSQDPRVTRLGSFLRRFSLDELPQLWNVLRGDMSLVGPRPPMPGEVSLYERRDRRRLSMRPGLTCIWQVSGRNNIKDFESWVRLDLEYIDNWSLSQDFFLLFRTIPAVLFGTGAR
jgi:exopolysaccharide biosynthesis polyprenyl glycosylphosphotransferase